jgi:ATP-dependent exoDNAse (exonuclease V) beta subunit
LDGTPQITLVGIVDLLVVNAERVDIIDYKTDRTRQAEAEYRKQLSVYYHVAKAWYPEKEITASIFYTADDERVDIEPVELTVLRNLAAECS